MTKTTIITNLDRIKEKIKIKVKGENKDYKLEEEVIKIIITLSPLVSIPLQDFFSF